MLSKKMEEALNAQINAEFWSAYLYLSMSVAAAAKGHKGVANWFSVQFKEEQAHAQIFMNYLLSRGGRVVLAPIAEVQTEWSSVLEMFRNTLIHNLCSIAADERDFASSSTLNWFVDEQIEEEANAQELIDSLTAVDGDKMGLYMIDKELAARTYVVPTPLAGKE